MMQVSLTDKQLATVVERSSFQYMKKHDAKFSPPRFPLAGKKPATMIRKGQTGASDELLNNEQQIEIAQLAQTKLQQLGSDFPYTELFPLSS